jgi:hypothetical protein
MTRITSNFGPNQLHAVKQVVSPADIPSQCPQNFNGFSQCFAAIAFNYLPMNATDTTPIDYTISGDGGLIYVNVYSHTSDFETRILPLQWAIDQVWVSLTSCVQVLIIYFRQSLSSDLGIKYPLLWNGRILRKPTRNMPHLRDLVPRLRRRCNSTLTWCLRFR